MSDLISRDALYMTLGVDAKECPKCHYGVSIYGYCTRGDEFQHVCEAIDDAPTVDAIPIDWIKKKIEWLKSLNNAFASITASNIQSMLNSWNVEQAGKDGDHHDNSFLV